MITKLAAFSLFCALLFMLAMPSLAQQIADPLGAEEMDDDGADHPAFTDEECDEVRDWVRGGGALLLVVDRAPFNGAADTLAKRFNVDLSKGPAVDQAHVAADRDNPGLV